MIFSTPNGKKNERGKKMAGGNPTAGTPAPARGIEKSRRGRRGGQPRHFPRPPALPLSLPHLPTFRPHFEAHRIPCDSSPLASSSSSRVSTSLPPDSIRLPSLLPSICRFGGFGSASRARSGPSLFLLSLSFLSLD